MIVIAVLGSDISADELAELSPPITARRLSSFRSREVVLPHSHYSADRLRIDGERNTVLEIVRNPLDIAGSYVNYRRNMAGEVIPSDFVIRAFVEGTIDRYGSWLDHVHGAVNGLRPFVRYEELLADPSESLERSLAVLRLWPHSPTSVQESVLLNSVDASRTRIAESSQLSSQGWDHPERFVAFARAGASAHTLTTEERERVWTVFGSHAERLGYEWAG